MRDDPFDRLVDELDESIARVADEAQAKVLIDRFAAALNEVCPSTATSVVALAALVRGILPGDQPLKVSLTSFARIVASLEVVSHPDGSPVYHGEPPTVLQ